MSCAASLLYLIYQLVRAQARSKRYSGYKALDNVDNVGANFLPRGGSGLDENDNLQEERYASEADQQLTLQQTRSRTDESTVEIDRPRTEVLRVALEELAVLGELAIHLAALLTDAWVHYPSVPALAGVVTWAYIAVLASLRLVSSSFSRLSFPRLWYHTAILYGLQWLFTALLFRAAIIHPRSKLGQNLRSADFALVSLLALIALTSRRGNRPVKLEYEGDLVPSKEQTASVMSLATFSWVDAIVWKGFRKTYELSDVWNLAPKDKAAAILSDYRLLKKTSILAWHLLRYFRGQLLLQASWACLSGLLTFVPTLLLKVIIEYVEDPAATPKSAAWFYVILLFWSGCASALADSHALWIGRKVCIRLRAIIIGELYAKALKRKASASGDKVLGGAKSTEQGTQNFFKRLISFGRKKKDDKATKKAEEDSSKTSDSQVTSGAIINLMAVDSFKVSEISAYLHFLWASTPVQTIVAVYLLYRILGSSSIAGIGMMALLLPINLFISKRFSTIQKQILAATDARIHMTNEVLTNIRIIKYFAWEQRFMGLVDEKRTTELKHLRTRYMWWAIAATIWSGAPVLISFLSFFVYTVIEKKDLLPSVAFTAISLFQILRIPLDQLADMVAHVQESKVSIDRIEEYLNEPETEKYEQLQREELDDDGKPVIGFRHASFTWGGRAGQTDADSQAFKIMDLNIRFPNGQLNLVIGATGSGKTSLLMALLGEMTILGGSVFLPGGYCREDAKPDPETGLIEGVAYCAQQAWLVNDTIKENIVFASPWDAVRYKNVLDACSLKRDLEILDAGDETLVGEKGVTLSGGQKQRISLARALYSKARHVLLDDVLSAVDSHTAKWIFDHALTGPLMSDRTCILVTHNVSLCLPHAQFAVVLENGRVIAQGSSEEVAESGKIGEDYSKSVPQSKAPSRLPSRPSSAGADEPPEHGDAGNGAASLSNGKPAKSTANGSAKADQKVPVKKDETEKKAEGGVKLNIILLYLHAMGSWYFWTASALIFAAQQASSVATNVWIRQWANAYATKRLETADLTTYRPSISSGGFVSLGSGFFPIAQVWELPSTSPSRVKSLSTKAESEVDSTYYLGVYAALGLGFMVITLLREGVLFGGSLHASRKIHQRLMGAIMRAKFRFFDSTPLGQIMNRFSRDIELVDQEIAPVAVGVVHCLASIITIVVLISVITPRFLIAAVFITLLYFAIGAFYLRSSVDLKRLESVQRSPLYQHFGETLTGMTTIRAYGDERRFILSNLNRVNTHNRPFIYLWATNRWLAFRVDVVGAMVSFFAGMFVVLSAGSIDAGAAGLAMTYAVSFTENVLWFVRLYSSNEQNMNSVERIKEYLDVEQEAKAVIPESRPPGNWPSKGSVEFIGYSTRYRKDFDFVLRKITFKINPGEKVGVVGRTGAGKSSLALALFRALEAEEGKILVDDIDIGLIGLQDLRENIVMVPQGENCLRSRVEQCIY